MAVFVRRDLWGLTNEDPWHPIIDAYARGVGILRGLADDDPRSLAWHAGIHGLADETQQHPFLNQCQHFSWYFLPWHRLYLYYYERIVRAAIQTVEEVDDQTKQEWALPYWDYEQGEDSRRLPPAFREEQLPDGSDNPLFDPTRKPERNQGDPLDVNEVRSDLARADPLFSRRAGRFGAGFGGPATGWSHVGEDPESAMGRVEGTPHGAVHVGVGGNMGGFDTAGLDPLFYLHHCNVDRLWEVWLGEGDGRANPPDDSPWHATTYAFHDEEKAEVEGRVADTVDTEGRLGYIYENTDPPPEPEPVRRRRRRPAMSTETPEEPPELVGATDEPIQLSGGEETVSIAAGDPTGPMTRRRRGGPERVYLVVEGVEGDTQPGVTYGVYVNLPDDDDADDDPESYYAGNLTFFGIEQVGRADSDRGVHPLTQSYDITHIYEELDEQGRWDPEDVKVTFSPLGREADVRRRGRRAAPGEGAAGEPTPPVSLGRVGLYFQ